MNDDIARIGIEFDTSGLLKGEQALRDVREAGRRASSSMEAVRDAARRTGDGIRRLSGTINTTNSGLGQYSRSVRNAAGVTSRLGATIDTTNSGLSQYIRSVRGASESTGRLSNTINVTNSGLGLYNRSVRDAAESTDRLGNTINVTNSGLGLYNRNLRDSAAAARQFSSASEQASQNTDKTADSFRSATSRAGGYSERLNETTSRQRNFSIAAQNTAFQMQDFITQVASGTSATRSLGQQLPQLLGGFGVIGAVAGAAAAGIFALVSSMGAMEDATTDLEEATNRYKDALKDANDFVEKLNNNSLTRIQQLRDEKEEIIDITRERVEANQALLDELRLRQQQDLFGAGRRQRNERGILDRQEALREAQEDLNEQRERLNDALEEEERRLRFSSQANKELRETVEAGTGAFFDSAEAARSKASAEREAAIASAELERRQEAANARAKAAAASYEALAEAATELEERIQEATRAIEDDVDALNRQTEQQIILARVTREEGVEAAEALRSRLNVLNDAEDRNIDLTTELGQQWLEARRSAIRAGEGLEEAEEAAKSSNDSLEDLSKEGERAAGIIAGAFEDLGRRITDSLEDALFRGGSLLDAFADIARRTIATISTEIIVDAGSSAFDSLSSAAQPGSGGFSLASLSQSASSLRSVFTSTADSIAQGAASFAPSVFAGGTFNAGTGAVIEAGSGAVTQVGVEAGTGAARAGSVAVPNSGATLLGNVGAGAGAGAAADQITQFGLDQFGVGNTGQQIGGSIAATGAGFAAGGPPGAAAALALSLVDNAIRLLSGSGADDSDLDTRIGRDPSNPGRGTNLPGGFSNVFVDADNNFTTEGANQVEDAISKLIGPQLEAINDSIFEITGQTINDFASGVRKTGDFVEDFLGGDSDFRDVINLVLQDTLDVVAESASREANSALQNGDLVASTLDVVSQDRELAGAFAGQLVQINQTGNLGDIERVFTAISNIEPSDPQQLRQVIDFVTTFDDQLSALSGGVQNFSESIRGGVVQNLSAVAQQLSQFENTAARAFGPDSAEVGQAREAGADFLRRLVGIRQTESETVTQTTAEIQRLDVLLEEATPLLDQYGVSLDAATEAIEAQQAEVLGLREAGLQLEAAGLSQTGNQLVQVGRSLENLRIDAEAVGLSAETTAEIIDGRFNAALSGVSQEQIPELISIFENLGGTIPGLDTILAELGERVSDIASLTAREGAQIRGEFENIFGPQGIQGQLQSLGIAGTELGAALVEAADAGIRPGTQAAEDFGERLIDLANGDLDLATSALQIFGDQVAELGRQAQEAANIESSRQESLGNRPLVELSPSELLSGRNIQLPRTSETTVSIGELSTGQLRSIIGNVITEEIDAGNQPVGTITPDGSDRSTTFALSTERDKSFFDSRTADQILDFIDSPNNSLRGDVQERLPTEGGGLTEAASALRSAFSDLQEFAEDREGVPDEVVDRVFDAIDAVNTRNQDFDVQAASSLASDLIDGAEPQPSSSSASSVPTGPSDDQLIARLRVRNPDLFPGEPTLDTRVQARGLGGTNVAGVLQDADLGNLDLSGAQDLAAELVDVAANGDNATQAIGILNAALSDQAEVAKETSLRISDQAAVQQRASRADIFGESLTRDFNAAGLAGSPFEDVSRTVGELALSGDLTDDAIRNFGLVIQSTADSTEQAAPALDFLAQAAQRSAQSLDNGQTRAQQQSQFSDIFGESLTTQFNARGLGGGPFEDVLGEAITLAQGGDLTQDIAGDFGAVIQSIAGPADEAAPALQVLSAALAESERVSQGTAQAEQGVADARRTVIDQLKEEQGELRNTAREFANIQDRLAEFQRGIQFGEDSPLSPQEQLRQSRQDFDQVRRRALGMGDVSQDEQIAAQQRFPEVAQQFLDSARGFFASGEGFQNAFNLVNTALDRVESTAQSEEDRLRQEISNLGSQISAQEDALRSIGALNEPIDSLSAAIDNLNEAISNAGDGVDIGSVSAPQPPSPAPSPVPQSPTPIALTQGSADEQSAQTIEELRREIRQLRRDTLVSGEQITQAVREGNRSLRNQDRRSRLEPQGGR